MTKSELRKLYSQRRFSLDEAECLRFSSQICDQFFIHIDLSFINIMHAYLPIEKNKEPNTWLILDRIKKEFPKIRMSLPRVRNNSLENLFLEGAHQLEKNKWDIPEPKQGIPTPSAKIDLVIVPLLAFDQSGNRIGYGKGFYDKFLKECRPDCMKVGLSFFEPIEKIIDVEEFDIALTHCITPTQLYQF
ncbi:MAG: 5-formyltetrahydrofolate cyclo-ligase [Bacteroidota bacterium]